MNNKNSLIADGIYFEVPGLKILNGAYITIEKGKVCGLFGLNGSGKSTLIKIIAGQIKTNTGITIINGKRYHKPSCYQRFSSIGYLPQETMLPMQLSVKRILKSCPLGKQNFMDDPILEKIYSQRVSEISGGERRYLELRLLFSLNRDYYLLDEPFTGIEPLLIEHFSEIIQKKAKENCGILITDHYVRYVQNIVDKAWLINHKQCYKMKENFREELKGYGLLK